MKALALLFLCCLPAVAKPNPPMEGAKVISQDLETENRGTAVMPIGTGVIGVPIYRRSNIVVVETEHERITWLESGNGKNVIILPVNGVIEFYRDGSLFVVTDLKGKKHKFGLVHLEAITHGAN